MIPRAVGIWAQSPPGFCLQAANPTVTKAFLSRPLCSIQVRSSVHQLEAEAQIKPDFSFPFFFYYYCFWLLLFLTNKVNKCFRLVFLIYSRPVGQSEGPVPDWDQFQGCSVLLDPPPSLLLSFRFCSDQNLFGFHSVQRSWRSEPLDSAVQPASVPVKAASWSRHLLVSFQFHIFISKRNQKSRVGQNHLSMGGMEQN